MLAVVVVLMIIVIMMFVFLMILITAMAVIIAVAGIVFVVGVMVMGMLMFAAATGIRQSNLSIQINTIITTVCNTLHRPQLFHFEQFEP